MNRKAWWREPLRVIQPNLQIRDTGAIDPERLASQMKEMGANTIVFNVGGIYAWYPTKVAHHTVNEFLPTSFDLLEEVIQACHKQDIRFIARFDFSKAEDRIFLQRPEWFVRKPSGEPEILGSKRPGSWSLLMSTCINGAYRNESVAIPVLEEVINRYGIDGIFFNAPGFIPCSCEGCRRKYREAYGRELPADRSEYMPEWASSCMRDNMDKIYSFIKQKKADIPMILYYNLYRDNLFDRERTTDMLCTEPQDVLSLGHQHIPEFWKPALSIKLGRSLPERPAPFGIVHSSPGMDWRHTGLPPAEYRFWLSQIPAHGGSIWHSLTGIPDTIEDKRILETVSDFNRNVQKVEAFMDGALPRSQTALMWTAEASAEGWADGLINNQIPFDVLLQEQATLERLSQYGALIIPGGMNLTEDWVAVLTTYVKQGGNIVIEGIVPEQEELLALLGISGEASVSEPLTASYLRFEGDSNPLQKGMETTGLIAHRGRVNYTRVSSSSAQVLATLVPPFSPLESVGAPPERASLPVSHTDIPLAISNKTGQGGSLYFPFSLSALINEYKLGEHYQLLKNAIDMTLGQGRFIEVTPIQGLQVTLFENNNKLLIHLVNGVGRRPLAHSVPLLDLEVKLGVSDSPAKEVKSLISGQTLRCISDQERLTITLPRLDVWECIMVELE